MIMGNGDHFLCTGLQLVFLTCLLAGHFACCNASIGPSGLQAVYTEFSGQLSDGPGNYKDDTNCWWIIAPKGATQVELRFSEFELEGRASCCLGDNISDLQWTRKGFEAVYFTPCPAGTYGPGMPDCTQCTFNCSVGKLLITTSCGAIGSTIDNECSCPPGQYSEHHTSLCIQCPNVCEIGLRPSNFHSCQFSQICSSTVQLHNQRSSIKEAVAQLDDGETLEIPSGYYTGSDSCDIVIRKSNVTIRSAGGPAITVVDCASRARHFVILGDNVTIKGIYFQNGAAFPRDCKFSAALNFGCDVEPSGGCVLALGRGLNLFNNVFKNCSATQNGGAISAFSAIRLEGVIIDDCYATDGGGVWSRDMVQIDDSTFNSTSAFRGGALFLSGGNATLVAQGLSILWSSARNSGGGIHARWGASIILKQNNVIKWNSAGANGGGAYLYLNSRLSILGNSTLESNVVLEDSNEYGGAAISAHEDSLVEIEDRAVLQNNRAIVSAGGCIRATHGCKISIRDYAKIFNNVGTAGGAIFADQKATINISGNVIIEGNIAAWYSGGGLYLGAMSHENNPLSGIGPVQLFVSGHVTFKNNYAEDSGGAIGCSGGFVSSPYVTRSYIYLSEHVSFIENSAQWLGGAIYSERTGTIKSQGFVSFLRNQAGETGGAIWAEGRTLVSIAGQTVLSRNFAGISAGAVGVNGADLEINGQVLIQENSALSYGGAIASRGQSHISMHGDPNIEHNCAKYGGGLFVGRSGVLDIKGQSRFVANHAEIGGALNIQDAELTTLGKVLFSANDALLQGGAISSSGKVKLQLRGVLLTRNQAGQQGGAIYLETESDLKVENGLFEENSAQRFKKSSCMNTISNVDEADSWQETFGGAACINDKSTVLISGESMLSKNRAAVGGAILLRGKSNTTIQDKTVFSFNIADNIVGICSNISCEGGAIAARGSSVLQVLDGSSFFRNRASGDGGAIISSDQSSVMISSLLEENVAFGNGGGLASVGNASIIVKNGTVLRQCYASKNGGCLYSGGSLTVIDGSSRFEGCTCDVDGGAVYALSSLEFQTVGDISSSTFDSNAAGSKGGAILTWHPIQVNFGHQIIVHNNTAGLDGGGVFSHSIVSFEIQEEGCPAAVCEKISLGNGRCDPACMTRGCNWDNGDCNYRFEDAAQDVVLECDRSKCSPIDQEYFVSAGCKESCFKASCDWSKSMCSNERANLAKCPLFDSTVLSSIRLELNQSLKFVDGGTARGYGRCKGLGSAEHVCTAPKPRIPVPAPISDGPFPHMKNALMLEQWEPADELSRYFNISGSRSSSWVHIAASDKFKAAVNGYTIEVWFRPQGWWMSKAFLIASEKVSLSYFDYYTGLYPTGCGGIILHLKRELCISYPADHMYATCDCGPKILAAKSGTITDGDGTYIPGVDDCTWLIAPTNATRIQLIFSKLELGGSGGRDREILEISLCDDMKCSQPRNIPGSPFDKDSESFWVLDCYDTTPLLRGPPSSPSRFPPSNSKMKCVTPLEPFNSSFIRVRFLSETSSKTTARFVLHYNTEFDSPLQCSGIAGLNSRTSTEPRRWHHTSAVVKSINCTFVEMSIYVNGSLKKSTVTKLSTSKADCPAANLHLTGDSGFAIGRDDTTNAPPLMGRYDRELVMNSFYQRWRGADSFWAGDIDELKLWNRSKTPDEVSAESHSACDSNTDSQLSGPLGCFGFDRFSEMGMNFADSGSSPHAIAVPIVGNAELPWCVTRGDDGKVLDQFSGTSPVSYYLDVSWGICTDKPRLPGSGFDYSEAVLRRTEEYFQLPLSKIPKLDGCVSTALNFTSNKASRKGGAIYISGCSDPSHCAFSGISSESGADIVVFEKNTAGSGGAIYLSCSYVGAACESILLAVNGIPSPGSLKRRFSKINFIGNHGSLYGDSVATEPATLKIDQQNEMLQENFIPGVEQLKFTMLVYDGLGNKVRGAGFVCRSRVCSHSVSACNDLNILVPPQFHQMDDSGAFSIRLSSVSCPVDTNKVAVQASLLSCQDLVLLLPPIQCAPCGEGQARTEDLSKNVWFCVVCANNQYIIDANNASFRCQNCPQGAICDGKSLRGRVYGSEWVQNNNSGQYILVACPHGYQMTRYDGADLSFAYMNQECSKCSSNEFILYSSTSKYRCQQCPIGASCDGKFLTGLVAGSVWIPDTVTGQYILTSCPRRYAISPPAGLTLQFSYVNQECLLCQSGKYCVGGSEPSISCPQNTFSMPGANSSASCEPSIFVQLIVVIPVKKSKFSQIEEEFKVSVAECVGTSNQKVTIVDVAPKESRSIKEQNMIVVKSNIVVSNQSEASAVLTSATDSDLNKALLSRGLPPAQITSVSILSSETYVDPPKLAEVVLILGVVIGTLVAIGAALIWTLMHTKKIDSDEISFQRRVAEMRAKLLIEKKHGFILQNERAPFFTNNKKIVFLNREYVEAAARIDMHIDFDLRSFDALCHCLDFRALVPMSEHVTIMENMPSLQYGALCTWLLQVSKELIDPDHEKSCGQESVFGENKPKSSRARFAYFEKVCKAQIWKQNNDELFISLKDIAHTFMEMIAHNCEARFEQICNTPQGEKLIALKSWPTVTEVVRCTGNISQATSYANETFAGTSATGQKHEILHLDIPSRQDHPEVRAVVVYSEVWLESEKEFNMLPISDPCEISIPMTVQSIQPQCSIPDRWRVLDETVFLNQLHCRASLLNADFQKAVLDKLCLKLVKQNKTSDDSGWNNLELADAELFFRDADLYDTDCILADYPLDEGFKFQRTMSGPKDRIKKRESEKDEIPGYTFTRTRSADTAYGPSAQLGFALSDARIESIAPVQELKSVPLTAISKISVLDFFKKLKLNFKAGLILPQKKNADQPDGHEAQSPESRSVMMCCFSQGPGLLAFHTAPVKAISRMREKLLEYSQKNNLRAGWPLTANILDPVRVSIVCNDPSHIMEVLEWFQSTDASTNTQTQLARLTVCRIKNKFSFAKEDIVGGYRDLMIGVVFEDKSGLKIIGEIQIHDKFLYDLKSKMHKLYKIIRASDSSGLV